MKEEKGKKEKTKGIVRKKGKLERHGTCHQVPQSTFSQGGPSYMQSCFGHEVHYRKYFQEEFSFQS